MEAGDIYLVIGYIDHAGAIHHRGLRLGEPNTHGHYWPMQTHKTWRFKVSDWQLENSLLSKDKLTPEEGADVENFIRRRYQPPIWVLEGELWNSLGRPRSGKLYEKYRRGCKKLRAKKS